MYGYKIPFIYTPPAASFGNDRSAIQHSEFVEQAISDLLIAGSVVQCECAPTVVNPLSVSIQANGKKRLILDLRYPNQFVKKSKIKFEDAKTMLYSFIDCSQDWLLSFDIKSGYHHIDFFPPDQEFLRYWRLQAIRIVVYLNDGLGVCPTFLDCYSQSMAVKSDLSQAGFVANSV